MTTTAHTARRRTVQGIVESNKMQKTVVVRVSRREQHPVYKKFVRRSRRYAAHDERNQCRIGDRVLLIETRPLSKTKRWAVKSVLEKAK